MGPTIDMAIVRELFGNTIAAAELLGVDPELRKELAARRTKLLPFQVGKQGQLFEWSEEFEETDPKHRHVSHLYGMHLHPGKLGIVAAEARR